MKLLPTKEDKLPPRTMKDSFAMSKIPLSTDRHMRELFGTVTGRVRIGRILESMDALAGNLRKFRISYKTLVLVQT